ncbi:unnamed protein product [Ambrosiozyma monospora]|uniref:Unnamed protein product n=1 Tax=Ambrosiozyma monospora TaxID=43982 RepID=A0ACB5U3Q9_AMBMO|nr:unnamed protein product [Ambrosiozyma monospora]
MTFDITKIARPNILKLEPYRCARDDFKEGVLLDANENTHGSALTDPSSLEEDLELNRYPDPHQIELKQQIIDFRVSESKQDKQISNELKGIETPITPENLCLGVGSDESIDAVIRCCCKPGVEKMVICPPTYGMYTICAAVNDVELVKIPLDLSTFQIQPHLIADQLAKDSNIKKSKLLAGTVWSLSMKHTLTSHQSVHLSLS